MNQCKKCLMTFSSKQRLKYHVINKVCDKNQKKKFYCIFCEKFYKTKYTFLRHLNNKHSKKNIIDNQ